MLLLEQARENKSVFCFSLLWSLTTASRRLRNSLEAGIDLVLPSRGGSTWRELGVLQRDRMPSPAFY